MTIDKAKAIDVNVQVHVDDGKLVGVPAVDEALASAPGDDKAGDEVVLKAIAQKEPEAGKMVYKLFATGPAAVKAVKRDDFTADIVISSAEIDRDKEIVEPKGLVISKPKRIPLVAGHAYGDLRKHIGDIPRVRVDGAEIIANARWLAGMGNLEADWAWTLTQEGLAAFSIGFLPIEWETADMSDEKVMERIHAGKEPIRRYTKWELAEVSQVIVPSNRAAIQRMVDAGVMSKELAEPILVKAKDEPMSDAASKAFDAALAAFGMVVQDQQTKIETEKKPGDHGCPDGQHMVDGECVDDEKKAGDVVVVVDPVLPEPEDTWKAIEAALAQAPAKEVVRKPDKVRSPGIAELFVEIESLKASFALLADEKIREAVDGTLAKANLAQYITEEKLQQTITHLIAAIIAQVNTLMDTKIAKVQGNVDAFRTT